MTSAPMVLALAGSAALLAACGADPAPQQQPGTLQPGAATVSVGGSDLGEFDSVQCDPAGPLMTITVGTVESGLTTVVSNADGLVAEAVSLRDLGGFTGSYNKDLEGTATVTMTGSTYTITGTALGFRTDDPSFRAESSFNVLAAC